MLRSLAPELANACFAATLRQIVVARDGNARWVDPLGLDEPTVPPLANADPTTPTARLRRPASIMRTNKSRPNLSVPRI